MLSKQQRLTKNMEFKAIYDLKKSVANSMFVLYVGKNKINQEEPTKVGFVIGKKIHKRSTKRNRIKRLMRESFREINKNTPNLIQKWDGLILIARQGVLEQDYNKVKNAFYDCLKKADKKFKSAF